MSRTIERGQALFAKGVQRIGGEGKRLTGDLIHRAFEAVGINTLPIFTDKELEPDMERLFGPEEGRMERIMMGTVVT